MIQRESRLHIDHLNILQQAVEYNLPLTNMSKDKKKSKQKSSHITILLQKLRKQRMIGTIIEQSRSRKYSSGKRKANSSLANRLNNSREKIDEKVSQSVEKYPNTFISAYEIPKNIKKHKLRLSKLSSPSPSPSPSSRQLRLPSLSNSPKLKLKQISKIVWDQISKQGRLKKDLLLSFLQNKLWKSAAQTFIRYFQIPFEGANFKANQFINQLIKIPDLCKRFFQFQSLDYDNDGIISIKDILDINMLILTQNRHLPKPFKNQFDKLSCYLRQYSVLQSKPQQIKTIFQTIINDRTTNLQKMLILMYRQSSNQSSNKQYIHHSSYRHTFLVFGHNQKMRARTQMIEQARNKMQNMTLQNDKGLSFGVYFQLPFSFLNSIIQMLTSDNQFKLIVN